MRLLLINPRNPLVNLPGFLLFGSMLGTLALGRCSVCRYGGQPVKGRVANLTRFNPGIAVEQPLQGPQYFRVLVVVIGVRALLVVPQTDGERLRLAGGNERDFVLEIRVPG